MIKNFTLIGAILFSTHSYGENVYGPIPKNIDDALYSFIQIFHKVKDEYVVELSNVKLVNACIKGLNFGNKVSFVAENDDSMSKDKDAAKKILEIVMSQKENFKSSELEMKIVACTEEMLESLDSSSYYMEEEDVTGKNSDFNNSASIGVSIKHEQTGMMISPLEGGAAIAAGMPQLSRLIEIDHQPLTDYRISQVHRLLRGSPNSEVHLLIKPIDSEETSEFLLKRVDFKILRPTKIITSKWFGEGYVYFEVPRFHQHVGKELTVQLNNLIKDKGADPKGIILDLRSNPGGLLSEAVAVSSLFLPKNLLIVQTKGRHKDANMKLKSIRADYIDDSKSRDFIDDLPKWRTTIPLAVLIDHESGGGSEIVAAAIKDYKRGVLIGENTFGNGKIQTIYPMFNKRAIKFTTAKFYTSLDQPFDMVGIKPDIKIIPNTAISASVPDETIQSAIEYLTKSEQAVNGH